MLNKQSFRAETISKVVQIFWIQSWNFLQFWTFSSDIPLVNSFPKVSSLLIIRNFSLCLSENSNAQNFNSNEKISLQ